MSQLNLEQKLKEIAESSSGTEEASAASNSDSQTEQQQQTDYSDRLMAKNINLFVRGGISRTRGNYPINIEELKEREQKIIKKLREDSENPALLHNALADVYEKMGDLTRAGYERQKASEDDAAKP